MRILILGGTAEARQLASRLSRLGHDVITSLAGRTSDPIPPEGKLRVGGFGGAAGLVTFLKAAAVGRLVDATHPYAQAISTNAVTAAHEANVPLVRLLRPAWPEPEDAGWVHAANIAEAATTLPAGARVLLTTGHEGLGSFFVRNDCSFLVRLIQRPEHALPPPVRLILARPPYGIEAELALFRRHRITALVSKNSGGTQTHAKLEAARIVEARVVMIDRPALPDAMEAGSIEEAVAALHLSDS